MNDEALKLKNQLCFPLYACSRKIISRYKPFLDEIGLTYTQYLVMLVLWEERTVSVKTLGERLYLDSGTLTPLLKKMETQGLVTRTRAKEDERSVLIAITDAGEALKQQALAVPQKLMDCIPIDPKDAGTLYTLLYQLIDTL